MDPPDLMVPESHPGEEPSPSRSALSAAPPGPIRSDELDPRASLEPGRPPTAVLPGLWLFPPNRDSQGGSAWLLDTPWPAATCARCACSCLPFSPGPAPERDLQ